MYYNKTQMFLPEELHNHFQIEILYYITYIVVLLYTILQFYFRELNKHYSQII